MIVSCSPFMLCYFNLVVISYAFPIPSVLQVAKIKNDEREDLKVLATGVAAALANRKVCCNLNSPVDCS